LRHHFQSFREDRISDISNVKAGWEVLTIE
jgi:hypothetical protein